MENQPLRYEEYRFDGEELPFVLYPSLTRTPRTLSAQANWHDSAEIEWVLEGEGTVRVGGWEYPFSAGELIVIAPGEIHYTSTKAMLRYGCLIPDPDFCRRVGLDPAAHRPVGTVRDERLFALLSELCAAVGGEDACRVAKSYRAFLSVLIGLNETYAAVAAPRKDKTDPSAERVKAAFRYLHAHYPEQIRLDDLALTLFIGKYQLLREFKRYTGMTVFTYLERLRCSGAAALILSGCPVGEAAERSGFRNLSFFTRVFKREYGCLPSRLKKTRELPRP